MERGGGRREGEGKEGRREGREEGGRTEGERKEGRREGEGKEESGKKDVEERLNSGAHEGDHAPLTANMRNVGSECSL